MNRSQGGIQYSWCNKTTGNQLTAWKPEEGWWPKDRPPVVNNYQCGQGRQCRSALSQEIVLPAQTVNPFWKQNLGKGFLSIFGQMTTWLPCNSPWFLRQLVLASTSPPQENGSGAFSTLTFWLMITQERASFCFGNQVWTGDPDCTPTF